MPGSALGTTRENTPTDSCRSSNTPSTAVDQRLKAAWLAQLKRAREKESYEAQERSAKRRKVSPDPPAEPRNVSTFSGRTRLPSLKVRERNGSEVKVELGDNNPLSAGRRVSGRKRAAEPEPEPENIDPPKKRRGRPPATNNVVENEPEHNPFMDEDGDDRRDKSFWPVLPVLPPRHSGTNRIGLLNFRPNPTFISRWRSNPMQYSPSTDSTPTLVDDDTDNDAASDEHPSTPENDIDEGRFGSVQTVPDVVDVPPSSEEDEEREVEQLTLAPKNSGPSVLKGLGLIAKPNPVTLAKRTWAPALIIADPEDEVTVPHELAEPRTPPRRRRQDACSTTTKSSPSQSDSTPRGRSPGSLRSVHVLESKVLRPRSIFDDYDASSGEEVRSFYFP